VLALLLGSLLAVLALAYVLWPLLRGAPEPFDTTQPGRDLPPESSAIEALREIEFDQATGKISPEDYAALRATYTPRAIEELRAQDAVETAEAAGATTPGAVLRGAPEDPAEALVARVRDRASAARASCPDHGPRPERDAVFCSDCGRFLGATCGSCGARVEGDRARFCTECGAALAA
jgi:hypothetical protein